VTITGFGVALVVAQSAMLCAQVFILSRCIRRLQRITDRITGIDIEVEVIR